MKKRSQIQELRELSNEGLAERIESTEEEMMNMRFRRASGQLENSARLRELRRGIARMKTLRNQKQAASS